MKKIHQIWSSLIATLLICTIMVNVGVATPQPPPPPPPALPDVYVDPSAIIDPSIAPGDTVIVNIMITEVTAVYGWGFNIYYKPSVLSVASIVVGDFHDESWGFRRRIFNDLGYSTAAAYFNPSAPVGIDGSGTLAVVTFNVLSVGTSLLDLANTKVNTLIEGTSVPIEHTASDGLFDNRIANAPPTASFFATPSTGAEGDTVIFDASAASDDGWIVDYQWNFGDRTTGNGEIAGHNYPNVGVYTVSLTVTDNEGATDTAQYTLEILPWMDGGYFPDLVGEMAWPEASVNPNEDKSFNEKQLGDHLTLWAKVGNPTDQTFEVRVDFEIYSDDGTYLGVVSSAVETIAEYETKTIPAYFYIADSRWRNYPYWRQKYDATAYCYHSTSSGGMEKGRFPGALWFRINAEDHDLAITGMTADTPVPTGSIVAITLTIKNEGWADQTATVTIAVDMIPVGSPQVVTVAVRGQETITFYWDTAGYNPDSYYVEARMTPHPFERDTVDNVAHVSVMVTF